MSTSAPPTASTPLTSQTQPQVPDPSKSPDRERTAQARAAVTAHLSAIGEQHLRPLEQRALDIKANSSTIDKQEAALTKQTQELEKESDKLHREADQTSKMLKELGDIQNWAEVLERDLLVVEETLRMGEGEDLGWETEEEDDGDGIEGDGIEGCDEESGKDPTKENEEETAHTGPGTHPS